MTDFVDFYASASQIRLILPATVLTAPPPPSIFLTIGGLIAQDAAPAAPTLFSPFTMFVGASLFLFYFVVMAPEKRRKADEEKARKTVRKNDRVVTIGGIYGTVAAAAENEDFVVIKVDNNTRLKINRSAIGQVIPDKTVADDATPET